MTTRTTVRSPGEPTWIDLVTPDLEGAKRFYQQLFGWEYVDTGEEFGHYHMATAQARNAAGMNALQPGQEMPPVWTIYFASADIDADVARVRTLGGQVYFEPMTVGDSGRMAICVDPTGAAFGLWQAINHIGTAVENEHGGMAWCEVNTRDAPAACNFYSQLFGFTSQKMEDMEYFMLQRDGAPFCGVMQMDEQWEGIPPHWMGYFAVGNTDVALEKVVAGGGKVLVPAFDMAYGRMAVIADPAGAALSIVQLAMA
jgi:predicted enzyme related to lactoylglutathione lyase